jgi:hypothetical protein
MRLFHSPLFRQKRNSLLDERSIQPVRKRGFPDTQLRVWSTRGRIAIQAGPNRDGRLDDLA